jgi:hypothetical protein
MRITISRTHNVIIAGLRSRTTKKTKQENKNIISGIETDIAITVEDPIML